MEAGGLDDGYVAVGVRLVEGDEVPGLEVEELDEGRGGGPLVGAPREGAEREGIAVGEMVAEERRDLEDRELLRSSTRSPSGSSEPSTRSPWTT